MFAVKPENTLKSNLFDDIFRRSPLIHTGDFSRFRPQIRFPASLSRVNCNMKIEAIISSGDKTAENATSAAESNGSALSSSSSGGIEVRAVVTIRKKMKEKITEKLEDQWECLMNGIGQGIQIQLISEEIDPG